MSDTGLVFLEAQEAQFDWTYMGTLPKSLHTFSDIFKIVNIFKIDTFYNICTIV